MRLHRAHSARPRNIKLKGISAAGQLQRAPVSPDPVPTDRTAGRWCHKSAELIHRDKPALNIYESTYSTTTRRESPVHRETREPVGTTGECVKGCVASQGHTHTDL
ncbi:hypothetical protein Bbelb_166140 [Branchiostoma belcheri]|nr:hypothetical protein Bbelb_166140 [Branchiostoma belcheri]